MWVFEIIGWAAVLGAAIGVAIAACLLVVAIACWAVGWKG
jgi:hypothetical protein